MNPEEYKSHIQEVIGQIKMKCDLKLKKGLFRDINYLDSLPKGLRDRVTKIIHSDLTESDHDVFRMEIKTRLSQKNASSSEPTSINEVMIKKVKSEDDFNESTASDILRMENDFIDIELKDKPTHHIAIKKEKKLPKTWLEEYLRQPYPNRIKWDSKLHKREPDNETADTSLENFADWFYRRFSSEEYTRDEIRKEVKSYFVDDTKGQFLGAYTRRPKEVRATSSTIADMINEPEMAMDIKYEKYMRKILNTKRKPIISAFGRTISEKDREWVPRDIDKRMKTIFPDELLSFRMLFQGLEQLNTMKLVVDFFQTHPHIQAPSYVKAVSKIKRKSSINRARKHIPLYDQLKLSY